MLSFLLQSMEAADAATQLGETVVEQKIRLLDMAMKGGWIMIVLLVLSVCAVYIFTKKAVMIHKAVKIDKNFNLEVRNLIHEGRIKQALDLCRQQGSPVARLYEKGIERIGRPLQDIQTTVENTGNIEVARLEKGLPMLATIAGGAPMIGFLGTVTGMIKAFFDMANAGNNIDISLLSSGIYEAMVTTVGGLLVGIIAYFGYNLLTSKISDVVFKLESATVEFMDMLNEPSEK